MDTSFRTSAEAEHPSPEAVDDITLDDVKRAFSKLFVNTRQTTLDKHRQQWTYAEIASAGGFLAVAGQLVHKTGLLNSGLGISVLGLSLSQFYDPGKTKDTHLAAEGMFVCMNTELGRVSEAKRTVALGSEDPEAAAAAQTAVDDTVAMIDEAIFDYRKRVLTQAASPPNRSDFARFAKEYAAKEEKATTQETDAAQKRAPAHIAVETQQRKLEVARAQLLAPAIQSLADGDTVKTRVQSAVATEQATLDRLREQQIAVDAQADAKSAGAKFIALKTNLEKCVQQFGQ